MGAVGRRSFNPSEPLGTRRHRPDYWLLVISALLLAIGLVVVYSISPALTVGTGLGDNYFVNKQLIAVGLGVAVFAITANMPLPMWNRFQRPLLIAAAVSAVAVRYAPWPNGQ